MSSRVQFYRVTRINVYRYGESFNVERFEGTVATEPSLVPRLIYHLYYALIEPGTVSVLLDEPS